MRPACMPSDIAPARDRKTPRPRLVPIRPAEARGDIRHLAVAEREIENRRVFGEPLSFAGAGNDDDVLLHEKAERDLGRGLFVSGADPRQYFVAAGLTLGDRAVRSHGHAVLAASG